MIFWSTNPFSANPRCEEIERELLPGQRAVDRPDLIARVFQFKKKGDALLNQK